MRTRTDKIMAIGGLFVVSLQALAVAPTMLQFALIFIAILITGAGLFGLGRRLQPDKRIYRQLRAEVDDFLAHRSQDQRAGRRGPGRAGL